MKADRVKIVFSYSADLLYKYIQSHTCLHSELEKHPRITFYFNFRDSPVMVRVSRYCILSFTLVISSQVSTKSICFPRPQTFESQLCQADKCTSPTTAWRVLNYVIFFPIAFQALRLNAIGKKNSQFFIPQIITN